MSCLSSRFRPQPSVFPADGTPHPGVVLERSPTSHPMDNEIRKLQHYQDPHWRIIAQRAGHKIPFQIGDTILVGPMSNWLDEIISEKWCGLPCPVGAVIVELGEWKYHKPEYGPKIVAILPPPYNYNPTIVGSKRPVILIDYLV